MVLISDELTKCCGKFNIQRVEFSLSQWICHMALVQLRVESKGRGFERARATTRLLCIGSCQAVVPNFTKFNMRYRVGSGRIVSWFVMLFPAKIIIHDFWVGPDFFSYRAGSVHNHLYRQLVYKKTISSI